MSELKNFGMVILTTSIDPFHKPDPNGAPIYAGCPAEDGWCACTGKCRKITGYNTDPDAIKAYHEQIDKLNELIKQRMNIYKPPTLISDDGTTKTYSWSFKQ
jgi:hypothetical protein